MQAKSADVTSVANHYSSELVAFVRRVMEAIPLLVFENLRAIMDLQTRLKACLCAFQGSHRCICRFVTRQ